MNGRLDRKVGIIEIPRQYSTPTRPLTRCPPPKRSTPHTSHQLSRSHKAAARHTPAALLKHQREQPPVAAELLRVLLVHDQHMLQPPARASRGAGGFWVENGRKAYPVSEITVAGNLKDMFLTLTPADDLERKRGIDSPTVRIDGMTVAGT